MTKDFGVVKLDGDTTFEAGASSCGSDAGAGNADGSSGQYGSGGNAASADTTSGPTTHARYGSPDDHHAQVATEFYRHDYWADFPVNVEAWLEKDALADVLVTTVVEECELDLHVTRGYSSVGYPQSAADFIRRHGR
jgi:hypothetical protein